MRLVTSGKGIDAYSNIEGSMRIDSTEGILWLKLDTDDKKQFIVALTNFEKGQLLTRLIDDKEALGVALRNGWIRKIWEAETESYQFVGLGPFSQE